MDIGNGKTASAEKNLIILKLPESIRMKDEFRFLPYNIKSNILFLFLTTWA